MHWHKRNRKLRNLTFERKKVKVGYHPQEGGNTEIVENRKKSEMLKIPAGVQPRLIQGIRSGDSVGEGKDTIASIRY